MGASKALVLILLLEWLRVHDPAPSSVGQQEEADLKDVVANNDRCPGIRGVGFVSGDTIPR